MHSGNLRKNRSLNRFAGLLPGYSLAGPIWVHFLFGRGVGFDGLFRRRAFAIKCRLFPADSGS